MSARSPRPRWVLIVALAGAGCAPAGEGGRQARRDVPCGVRAAMDYRQQSEALRESPPACALPTAKEVESSCAIHDLVTAPGYRPPSYDEEGITAHGDPPPDYKVSGLDCRFTGRHRNRAVCRFALSIPSSPGPARATVATFEHRFWQDHGPAHHFYGTRWSPADRCIPLPGSGKQG